MLTRPGHVVQTFLCSATHSCPKPVPTLSLTFLWFVAYAGEEHWPEQAQLHTAHPLGFMMRISGHTYRAEPYPNTA